MLKSVQQLNPIDNVAVVLFDQVKSATICVNDDTIYLLDSISSGHKVALADIPQGSSVIKYGYPIGIAKEFIAKGTHVHTHNLDFSSQAYKHPDLYTKNFAAPALETSSFSGYQNPNGQVATRKYIAVIPTVNCSASIARKIADSCNQTFPKSPTFDGFFASSHWSGCGLIEDSLGLEFLRRTLAGLATNPNIFGVIFVSLGCEDNDLESLVKLVDTKVEYRTVVIQDDGGSYAAVKKGILLAEQLYNKVHDIKRSSHELSHLLLGLNCGGSDAFSGITSNPILGYVSDLLISNGGRVILAETPEIFGAEQLLTSDPILQQKIHDLYEWWHKYTFRFDASMNANPAPGNKKGGITTIVEKSLGAAVKGGTSSLIDVLRYSEKPDSLSGLYFMDTPGYDPVSVTGLQASGVNIMCFTTGRGSVFGSKPAPCIKLSSNTALFKRQKCDVDFNCGDLLTSNLSIEQLGSQLFHELIRYCSGEQTKSELFDMGNEEFIPWIPSPVM